MKKKIVSFIMALSMLLAFIPLSNVVYASSNANLSETVTLVIVTSQCSIYSSASTSGSKVATAYKNSTYPCLDTQTSGSTSWYKIQYGSSSTGWVSSSYATKSTVSCDELYSDTSSLTRLVTPTSNAKLYATASTSASSVGTITTSNVATVIDDGTGSDGYSWFKVKFGSTEGWISRRSVSITNVYTSIATKTFSDSNIPVIYLSPSRQTWNPYSYGSTNECEQMYKVAESLKSILESTYVCKVYIADISLTIEKDERPLDAANLGADIYLAIHSNASSSSFSKYGTEAYYYPGSSQSKTLATNLVSSLNAISSFSTSGSGIINGMSYLSNYGYGEVRSPSAYNMVSLLLEVQYHDNADSAKWIINNIDSIAQAIANGLNSTFNFTKKSTTTTSTTTTTAAAAASAASTTATSTTTAAATTAAAASTTTTTTTKATTTTTATTTTAASSSKKLKVTASALNVRSGAGTSNKVLTVVKRNSTYTYTDTKTVNGVKWYKITVSSSISGWVSGTYVSLVSSSATTTTTSAKSNTTTTTKATTTKATTATTTAASSTSKLKVTASALNVRSGAGTSNKVLTVVKRNSTYTYTDTKTVGSTKWYEINVSSSVSGWVCGKYVSLVSSTTTTTTAASSTSKLKVTASALNVRSGAGTSNKVLTVVKKNATYTYTSTKTVNGVKWYKINVSSSVSGWVCGKYIKTV